MERAHRGWVPSPSHNRAKSGMWCLAIRGCLLRIVAAVLEIWTKQCHFCGQAGSRCGTVRTPALSSVVRFGLLSLLGTVCFYV
jgi:hypothetical protein